MQNLAQFIQTIVALRGLEAQDRQLKLAENTRQDRLRTEAMGAIGSAPLEARASIIQNYSKDMNLSDVAALTNFAGAQPESTDTQRANLARIGLPAEGPARDRMATATASTQFTGALPGALAQSDLLRQLIPQDATATFGERLMKGFQEGFMQRTATGQTPGQAAQDQAVAQMDPAQLAQIAKIQGGLAMSVPQIQQAGFQDRQLAQQGQIQMQDIASRASIAAGEQGIQMGHLNVALAAARAKTGMTPQEQGKIMEQADKIAEQMGKGAGNEAMQKILVGQWNQYMQMLGRPDWILKPGEDVPTKVGGIQAMLKSVFGSAGQVMTNAGAVQMPQHQP